MEIMWDEFISYCEKVLYKNDGESAEDFKYLVSQIKDNGKREYKNNRANADFGQMIAVIGEAAKKEAAKKEAEKRDVLIHIKKICDLLQAITEQEQDYISFLEKNKAVKVDYIRGKKKWEELRSQMALSSESQDKLIRDLLKLSVESKMYLKDKHYKVGEVKDKKLNEDGIKFLLRSYYSQKIKDSRMEREE